MKPNPDYYQILKDEGLTDKEIAEAYVLPMELSEEDKAESSRLIKEYRKEIKDADDAAEIEFKYISPPYKQILKDAFKEGWMTKCKQLK